MPDITVNGEVCRVNAATLAALVAELGLADAVIATALNGDFVPKGRRARQQLTAGDTVDIVAPMQGG